MVREMHPAEKINARGPCLYKHLVRMQRQLESCLQKFGNSRKQIFQVFFAFVQNDEIVRISDAMFDFQLALEKVVKLVHIHIH